MSDNPKLKPCPFCGGEPQWSTLRNGAHYVECLNEDCLVNPEGVFSGSKVQCANEWNTRTAPKVKPLVWDWVYEHGVIAQSKCSFGYYTVLDDEDSSSRIFMEMHTQAHNYCERGSIEISSGYDEPEDFFKVAQADYERRIIDALT